MSIRPEYAEAIFRGEKRYEFRRVAFGRAVGTVVVYVTSPVCAVWGEFEVTEIISARLSDLWSRTRQGAGIGRKGFFDYFAGKEIGIALKIGRATRYRLPKDVRRHFGVLAPQSFAYLDRRGT